MFQPTLIADFLHNEWPIFRKISWEQIGWGKVAKLAGCGGWGSLASMG